MKQYTLKTQESGRTRELLIDYAKELNAEQLPVVENGDGPCLVLAGAGSGKTRTLVYRVAWLLEHGVNPQNILLMTFTNKASKQMLERVRVLLKQEVKGLWGGTFHHIGNRVLRQFIVKLGYQRNFIILDASDAKELIAASLQELPFDTKQKFFPKSDTVHAIISFADNSQKPIAEVIRRWWPKFEQYTPHIEACCKIYQDKKKRSNVLDYDDLLTLWLKLVREQQDVKNRLAAQFKYILVDEYQDTNHIQAEIIRELASVHQNVLVVGDDAQSIYSFRAADVANILEFPKLYSHTKIFKLETNYRSTQDILRLANESIRHNKIIYEKTLKHARDGLRIKPGVVPLSDANAQANFLIQRILELRDEGRKLGDMAVLFRAAHLTLELEVELARANIPYIKRGGIRYFEQAHIKDLVSYLKILVNPRDEIAWRRVLKLYEGIGDKTANEIIATILAAPGKHLDLFNQPGFYEKLSPRPGRSLKQLAQLLLELDALAHSQESANQLGTVIKRITRGGYREIVMTKFDDAEDRVEDLEQLAEFATSFDSIESFLSDVALSEGYRAERLGSDNAEDEDYLVLSTIHQAKGLEWNAVFVIGLVEGQFPHSKSLTRGEDLEEERRLFYVAVTRAKDELYLTYPLTSFYGSALGRSLSGPSRFVTELSEKVYEPWQVGNGFETTVDLED